MKENINMLDAHLVMMLRTSFHKSVNTTFFLLIIDPNVRVAIYVFEADPSLSNMVKNFPCRVMSIAWVTIMYLTKYVSIPVEGLLMCSASKLVCRHCLFNGSGPSKC